MEATSDKDINNGKAPSEEQLDEQESLVDDQLEFDDKELGDAYYKLIEMKKARQAAQENAKKLENRINLLNKEQQKVMRKVEAVRKKAKDIMKIKQRNEESQRKREEQELKRLQELQSKQQKIVEMKAEHEEKINISRQQQVASSQMLAKNTKEALRVS